MQNNRDNIELLINKALDAQISEASEHALNRSLIRDPEMMRLRDDYQKLDAMAGDALNSLRGGKAVDFDAVFSAATVRTPRRSMTPHRGWLLIPGAIAAALLAVVIPDPTQMQSKTPPVIVDQSSLFPTQGTGPWSGERLARPVSTAPRIQRQTGTDVIGVVGDDGNLYWIEVERKKTVRWPSGSAATPDPNDSM